MIDGLAELLKINPKDYICHYNKSSPFIDKIERKFKLLNGKFAQFPSFMVWNPANLWVSDKKIIDTNINKFESFIDLNDFLSNAYYNKQFYSICYSGKMPIKRILTNKITEYNCQRGQFDVKRKKYFRLKSDFFTSKGLIIELNNNGIMEIGITPQSFEIEIHNNFFKKSYIKFNTINSVLEDLRLKKLEVISSKSPFLKDVNFLEKFYDSYCLLYPKEKIEYDDFTKKLERKSNTWIRNKFQAIELYNIINNKAQIFIDYCLSYSADTRSLISPYIKIK